ncbi:MAG: alpha/beta hydrolase [Neomegalonema sp.]|nr:alpha/beta hydrolase [Neomegalonema sp.]
MLDAQVQGFVDETLSLYPDDAASLSIEAQRALYDAMAAHFREPRPEGMLVRDEVLAGGRQSIPVRHYCAPVLRSAVRVVYFHGGGFALGGLDSHDDACAQMAQRTGLEVIAVDYRLVPEHLHPAALHDAIMAARLIAEQGPIILAGDSVGGNLAASTAIALRDEPAASPVLGQVLIYPSLGGEPLGLPAYGEHRTAPLLSLDDLMIYWRMRIGAGADAPLPWQDPDFAPLAHSDLRGLAPCLAFGVEFDPLRDDPEAWCQRLRAAGVASGWYVAPGLVHGCLRARTRSERARDFFARVCTAITHFAASDG